MQQRNVWNIILLFLLLLFLLLTPEQSHLITVQQTPNQPLGPVSCCHEWESEHEVSKLPTRQNDAVERNPSFGEQKNTVRGERRFAWWGCCPNYDNQGRACMSNEGQATYRLQARSAKTLCTSISSHRVCPLLKATRVRLSITSLLKDTFNYSLLSWDHFFYELHVSLACALRSGTNRSMCCFLPPIKGHVDRLRLLLVCAPLMHLKEGDEHKRGWGGVGGGSKPERGREREREREIACIWTLRD